MTSFDAIVIGGGPSGSTVGLCLAEAGLKVAIVEKSPFPRQKVCGEFVSATTIPLLEAMGLGETVAAISGPAVQRVGVFVRQIEVIAEMPSTELRQAGRVISRSALDPLLLETAELRGARIFQPYKVISQQRDELGSWTCDIKSGDHSLRLTAPIVLAAHGSWETSSLPTQAARQRRSSDLLAFKFFFRKAGFESDLMALLAFPGGYGGIVSVDEETVGLSCCIRRDVLRECRERAQMRSAGESVSRYILQCIQGLSERLGEPKPVGGVLASGPLNPGVRPLYEQGIFRVGNAAGEAHPVIAEGISMAIQSGIILGDSLISNLQAGINRVSLESSAHVYGRAWNSHFKGRIRAAQFFSTLAMSPSWAPFIGRLLSAYPNLVTFGAALSGKTKTLRRSLH